VEMLWDAGRARRPRSARSEAIVGSPFGEGLPQVRAASEGNMASMSAGNGCYA
jgi:hypothetical protein